MRPPTDNLYKFLALSGLLLFGFCVYTPLQKLDELAGAGATLAAAEASVNDMRSKLSDYDNIRTLDCAPGVKVPLGRQIDCADWLREAKSQADAATAALPALREKANEASARYKFFQEQYHRYSTLCWVGAVIGFVCALVGFFLWYFRLQRFLDAAVARGDVSTDESPDHEDADE